MNLMMKVLLFIGREEKQSNRVFHKRTKIGIIANFVLPYIYSFFLCLHHIMLVNIKLDISGSNKITFQGYKCH